MPSSDNVIQVIINGKNNAMPAFKSATQMIARFGAVSVAALTAAAVRAGQFEKGMAEISTLLDGDVTPSIERMRGEILQLSVEFGQTMGKMTKARYDIISAGFTNAADSAAVLTAANKLAVAGVSDVAIAADLLTDALGGMELGASEAARVSDILFQTVRKGKTTITELGAGLGKVFGTAKTAGVSLEEVGAAMATATASGVKTAEAITGLNALILALAAPTKESADALEAAGISMKKGFMQALIDVGSASGDSLAEIRKLIPSIEALRVAAKIAGNIDLMGSNLEAMAKSAGVTETALKKMMKTFDFQSRQARAALDALVIEVGTAVLPVFTRAIGVVRDTAVMIRFLATETRDGIPLWKSYGAELVKAVPGLNAAAQAVKFIADRVGEMNDALDVRAFDQQVTAVMKSWQKIPAIMDEFKTKRKFLPDSTDFEAMRKLVEEQVRAMNAAQGTPERETFFDKIGSSASDATKEIRKVIAEIQAAMDAAQRATKPASEIIVSGFGAPRKRQAFGPDAPTVLPDEAQTKDQLDTLKEQVADLAQFTAEDFAQMAFNIGDSFAMVATDIGAHMLGLTKGPLMLGRAFAQMAAGIMGDIARIIARLMVAKALMAAFGGGGIIGGIAKGLGVFSNGGTIPQAAFGMGIPGGGMSMPSMIVPGSPGLDRSLVWAHGGEVMVPRQTVEAIDRSRKRAQTAPPPARRRSGTTARVELINQAVRPFRREEQNLLTDSITEGLDRSSRYRG